MRPAQSQGNSFLLEEIVFNILIRLPVKSICRFKCVCRTWLSIISARLFVDSHAARSQSQPKLLVTIYRDRSRYLFIGDPTPEQYMEDSSLVVLRPSITMPVKNCSSFGGLQISPGDSQSVGGLMFSICSHDLIQIANPSTNKCIVFSPRRNDLSSGQDKTHRYVFLGFDPVEGKHKFLESKVESTEHRVVTVGDDAICWRYIKDGPSINRGEGGGNGEEICVNGVIYFTAWVIWPSRGIEGSKRCMVTFDVKTESFQAAKISMKEKFHYMHPWIFVEFEGKVAVVNYALSDRDGFDLYHQGNTLELWVLEDFQSHVWSFKFFDLPSLSTLMTSNPFTPKLKLVGTTLDGELVFALFEGRYDGTTLDRESVAAISECGYDNDSDDDGTMIHKKTEEGVPIYFLFFDMKTRDFRKSKVCFLEGFALTSKVKITVMGHVEKLLLASESETDYAKTLATILTGLWVSESSAAAVDFE